MCLCSLKGRASLGSSVYEWKQEEKETAGLEVAGKCNVTTT